MWHLRLHHRVAVLQVLGTDRGAPCTVDLEGPALVGQLPQHGRAHNLRITVDLDVRVAAFSAIVIYVLKIW